MGRDCNILVPEDFVLSLLTNPKLRDRYQECTFRDHVKVTIIVSKQFKSKYFIN